MTSKLIGSSVDGSGAVGSGFAGASGTATATSSRAAAVAKKKIPKFSLADPKATRKALGDHVQILDPSLMLRLMFQQIQAAELANNARNVLSKSVDPKVEASKRKEAMLADPEWIAQYANCFGSSGVIVNEEGRWVRKSANYPLFSSC